MKFHLAAMLVKSATNKTLLLDCQSIMALPVSLMMGKHCTTAYIRDVNTFWIKGKRLRIIDFCIREAVGTHSSTQKSS
ncbi:hypothetical protein pipiens_005740 [Culex pipiens pipiens]|uniref:Uncharacterized protein n=1 Tax=Culex pipiens pipiens TaxID=38569 RepID=A0ABD1DU89_CULPP